MKPCSCWLSAEMLPEIWSSAALWVRSSTSSALVLRDQADHLVAALGQHGGDLVGVGQQVAQLRVALVERLREPGHTLDGDLQIRWGVGECLGQHRQRVGQLIGVQAADGGREIAQRVGQLIGRGGALDRDRAVQLARRRAA